MRCGLCGLEGATALKVHSGALIGHAHDGECQTLLWESYFLEATGCEPWERVEHQWRWRRQVAKARGEAFTEPPPKSPGEVAVEKQIGNKDWADVAREVA